jgi:hypothetical protein
MGTGAGHRPAPTLPNPEKAPGTAWLRQKFNKKGGKKFQAVDEKKFAAIPEPIRNGLARALDEAAPAHES